MVSNYVDATSAITTGLPVERLVLSGGLVQRFMPLRESISQAFDGIPMRICTDEDASLKGLQVLASEIAKR
jgi:hypothetical protein